MRFASAIVLAALLAGSADAADAIKAGKWEFAAQVQVPNMPKLPGVTLPPGINIGPGGINMTRTSCVTASTPLPADIHPPTQQHGDCKVAKLDSSGGTVRWESTCAQPDGGVVHSEGVAHYTGDTMEASVKTRISGGGNPPNETMGRAMANETPPRRRQIQLSDDERAAFLAANRKAALATIDRDGFPHLVAMTCGVRDGAFYMTSYAKAQKVLNIRRNPKVALMVEAGAAYAELKGVMVRGLCEIVEGEDAVREAWAVISGTTGAPRRRETNDSAAKRVVLKVTPYKIASWDHSKLGGRY
jgi:PPOX class probable F420-dependent enzyme